MRGVRLRLRLRRRLRRWRRPRIAVWPQGHASARHAFAAHGGALRQVDRSAIVAKHCGHVAVAQIVVGVSTRRYPLARHVARARAFEVGNAFVCVGGGTQATQRARSRNDRRDRALFFPTHTAT